MIKSLKALGSLLCSDYLFKRSKMGLVSCPVLQWCTAYSWNILGSVCVKTKYIPFKTVSWGLVSTNIVINIKDKFKFKYTLLIGDLCAEIGPQSYQLLTSYYWGGYVYSLQNKTEQKQIKKKTIKTSTKEPTKSNNKTNQAETLRYCDRKSMYGLKLNSHTYIAQNLWL